MRTRLVLAALAVVALAAPPAIAAAQTINFKLLPRYSYTTFKSDAPLETVVGHTADTGLQGDLSVDPARPQAARGTVKVDMNTVRTGIDKRDADMRSKTYLETDIDANRWVTFEVQSAEVAGPLESGKPVAAKIRGLLSVKQKPVERTAEGTVTYITLSPEQVEAQKQVPQLLILKLSNDILIETDLTFVRP